MSPRRSRGRSCLGGASAAAPVASRPTERRVSDHRFYSIERSSRCRTSWRMPKVSLRLPEVVMMQDRIERATQDEVPGTKFRGRPYTNATPRLDLA